MSIHEIINEAQRINHLVMEDLENEIISPVEAALKSDNIFTNIITKHIAYDYEKVNISNNSENLKIIMQLYAKEITAPEAAVQSNSIWIDRINKFRNTGEVKINLANYRRSGIPEFLNSKPK